MPDTTPPAGERLFSPPFVALVAMQLAFGLAFSIFLLLPKYFASVLGANNFSIGIIGAAFGVASVVSVPLLGWQLQRFGTRTPIVAANALLAATALGFLTVDRVGPSAVLLRGLQGLSWTMVFNSGMTLATFLVPPSRMAQGIGVYGSANLLMNAIAPAVAEPVIARVGWRPVFAAGAVIAAIGAALGLRLREAVPAGGGEAHERMSVLLRNPRTIRLGVATLITGVAFGVLFTFPQPYALSLGIDRVSGFFTGYTVGALAIRLGASRLADRLGHQRAIVIALGVYAPVTAATALLTAGTLPLFGLFFGAAHGLFVPAVMAHAVAGASAHARGQILGIMNGCLTAGFALIPVLGAVADAAGYRTIFALTGVAVLLALVALPRPGRV